MAGAVKAATYQCRRLIPLIFGFITHLLSVEAAAAAALEGLAKAATVS